MAEAFALVRIAAHRHEHDAIVTRSVETLESCAGGISMDELVAASGIGRRQLERVEST